MLLSHAVTTPARQGPEKGFARILKRAYNDACSLKAPATEAIGLEDVASHNLVGEPLAVVDWLGGAPVTAKVQPVDSGLQFRGDRTYLSLGLVGEMGHSVAEWMVRHGARCVVLSSRSSKVKPEFIIQMEMTYGAKIKPWRWTSHPVKRCGPLTPP